MESGTRFMGTTVTPEAMGRDAVLAGGFLALVAWAAFGEVEWLLYGLIGGAFLGSSLHAMPPEPLAGDSKVGRLVIRVVSGLLGGAGTAPGLVFVAESGSPEWGDVAGPALWGALAGAVWYFVWGLWETPKLES